MFRRNHLTLIAATLAAALAACATSKPVTSVGALAYPAQSQSAGTASERFAVQPTARPVAPSNAAEPSTNDPMFRLDMP